MKKILATIAVIACTYSAKSQTWTDFKLADKINVSLPGTPTEDKSKGMPVQKVVLDDSAEIYAGVIDYSVFGMDEAMLQKLAGTDEFKQQMEAGIGMQPGVTLVKNDAGKYDEKYYSFDMVLNVDKDGKKSTVSNRQVIYKQYGIIMGYKPGLKGENATLRDKFFNSLKISE